MEYAYRAYEWQALYSTLAGATATLIGLLFVALSLNLRTIIKVSAYTARVREALGGLLSLLILSLLVLIPGQSHSMLGAEIITGSFALAVLGVRLQLQTLGKMPSRGRIRWALRLALLNLGMVTSLIAGISLIIGQFGGLFWLVPTILLYILWSLNNAWLLMVQATEEP